MSAPQIVIEVRGGVVVAVSCSDPDATYTVVDWDDVTSPEAQVAAITATAAHPEILPT